jgi:hypothetical protein
MQTTFAMTCDDFSHEIPSLGLSGGINSAALLCYLATEHPESKRPKHLLLYYAHLREHSPDTFRFVKACVRYARNRFPKVEFGMHRASVIDFFEKKNFIPHPTISPCTEGCKTLQMDCWSREHGATLDLIGYVMTERRRLLRAEEKARRAVAFPIFHLSDADCFRLVNREIGWHPAIYDIRDENGKRAFTHNNCLPCKNMTLVQIRAVAKHFPKYWDKAEAMAKRINSYWGRSSEYPADPCASCVFD